MVNGESDNKDSTVYTQDYYSCVPPSLAHFSREEQDVVVYCGYGMQKNVQFYSLTERKVCMDSKWHCEIMSYLRTIKDHFYQVIILNLMCQDTKNRFSCVSVPDEIN